MSEYDDWVKAWNGNPPVPAGETEPDTDLSGVKPVEDVDLDDSDGDEPDEDSQSVTGVGDGETPDDDYEERTVEQLKAEIDTRNGQGDDEDDLIEPESNRKADLIEALRADDKA